MGTRIANAIAHKSGDALISEIQKAFVYYMKHGGTKATIDTFKAVMKSLIPVIGQKAYEIIMQNVTSEPVK